MLDPMPTEAPPIILEPTTVDPIPVVDPTPTVEPTPTEAPPIILEPTTVDPIPVVDPTPTEPVIAPDVGQVEATSPPQTIDPSPVLVPPPVVQVTAEVVAPTSPPEAGLQEIIATSLDDSVTAQLPLESNGLNLPFVVVGVLNNEPAQVFGFDDPVPVPTSRRFDFPLPTEVRGPNPPSITQASSAPLVSTIIMATLGGVLVIVGLIAILVFTWRRNHREDSIEEMDPSEPRIVALPPLERFHTHEMRDLVAELEQTGISAVEIDRIRQSILIPNEETQSIRVVEEDGLDMRDVLMPMVSEYDVTLQRSDSTISTSDPFKRAGDDISYPNSIV
jgi:hypothetical protein